MTTPKHFTFCWNGYAGNVPRLFDNTDTNKYALLYQQPDEATFETVPLEVATRLFGLPLFIKFSMRNGNTYAVVAGNPRTSLRLVLTERHNVLFVVDRNKKAHRILLSSLYRVCHRLEKFSLGCRHCPLDSKAGPGDCIEAMLQEWCGREGLDPLLFKPTRDRTDGMEPVDLEEYLEQMNSKDFVFASPRVTREHLIRPPDGKVNLVRHWTDHYLDHVKDNCEDVSERSRNAAKSRAAHRICDSKCYYAEDCSRRHNSYRSQAHSCQKSWRNGAWWKKNNHMVGPYTKEEVHSVYQQWYDQIRTRSVEEISFIAYNAGVIIYHYPYELYLAGMDSNLDNVVFQRIVRDRKAECVFFSYEDALELLRTPSYSPSSGAYSEPDLEEPPWLLNKEEQLIYAELRQFQTTNETYGFGNRNPTITEVVWNTAQGSFSIRTHIGRVHNIDSLNETQCIFGLDDTINSFEWVRLAEGPAKVCRVSNPDILP